MLGCLLLIPNRTFETNCRMSANDPKRTLVSVGYVWCSIGRPSWSLILLASRARRRNRQRIYGS
jgi:hypothetical protein